MAKDKLLELFDLADRKGFEVTRAILDDHVRLTRIADDKRAKTETGSAAFSYKQAIAYLEAQPEKG